MFGELDKEKGKKGDIPVFRTPKYEESRAKAISIIEQYDDITEGDFWILKRENKAGTCMVYSGLIISHNGCLKLNDVSEDKFDPNYVHVDKEGYVTGTTGRSLVVTYKAPDLFEVGEVNAANCKNDYPYAMAYKRCFDRVVLKKTKLAYAGIYSDSEAEEFKEPELTPEQKEVKRMTDAYPDIELMHSVIACSYDDIGVLNDWLNEQKVESLNELSEAKRIALYNSRRRALCNYVEGAYDDENKSKILAYYKVDTIEALTDLDLMTVYRKKRDAE